MIIAGDGSWLATQYQMWTEKCMFYRVQKSGSLSAETYASCETPPDKMVNVPSQNSTPFRYNTPQDLRRLFDHGLLRNPREARAGLENHRPGQRIRLYLLK